MKQEVRLILREALAPEQAQQISIAKRINSRFVKLQVESLPIPDRQVARTPPKFNAP